MRREPAAGLQTTLAMTNILAGVPEAATSEKGVSVRIARAGESQYAAVLVPVLEGGRIVLFRRYRYPIAGWSLELPRSDWTNDARGWATSANGNLLARDRAGRATNPAARQHRGRSGADVDRQRGAAGRRVPRSVPQDDGARTAGRLAGGPA